VLQKPRLKPPAGETDIDHVHCFAPATPGWAPAEIVGLLKGYNSGMIRKQLPQLA
jgi:REP element-mobilizing transposase RayT